tara:strand:- start:3724 stop:4131 length:408 start_codon:yes stop_codon:yes gene_type:complete
MIRLNPSEANQSLYCTPFQGRKEYSIVITHYLFAIQSLQTKEVQYCVADVQQDNARYTEVAIGTHVKSPLTGNVLISESGLYTYIIYGQINGSNYDPTGAAVVGELSRGMLTITENAEAWTEATIQIPDNVVYYE